MPVLTNKNGHPTSGTTTERTSTRYAWEAWETFYDTTLGQLMVYTGSAWIPADASYQPVAAANVGGTAQGNGTAVGFGFTAVSGADNTAAVTLPTPVAGRTITLKNLSTTATVKVFPAASTQINALTNNTVHNLTANTAVIYQCYNATQYYTVPHAPS